MSLERPEGDPPEEGNLVDLGMLLELARFQSDLADCRSRRSCGIAEQLALSSGSVLDFAIILSLVVLCAAVGTALVPIGVSLDQSATATSVKIERALWFAMRESSAVRASAQVSIEKSLADRVRDIDTLDPISKG